MNAPSSASPRLAAYRKLIDALDSRIVALLNRRAVLAQKIGEEKKRDRQKVYEPGREQQVLDTVEAFRHAPLDREGLARIYKAIMLTMRLLQKADKPKNRRAG